MVPQWVIEKKRDGHALDEEEIRTFIFAYAKEELPDYQMAALAMAVFLNGMNAEETAALTRAMMDTGVVLDTSKIPCPKVDKHSTGGIGDKVSLVLAPMLACCGVAVPMLSGRGLGITGGTLDKLESIPGYRTDLSEREFLDVVARCGCAITGQTERLAPADRKLYALRDVTGTVPSIPLITASIMCKKLAEGIDHLVLDVKCGAGAFMPSRRAARDLAASLVRVGRAMGKGVAALVTPMEQPLGKTVGNALEVMESVETLRGQGPADLAELSVELSAELLVMAGSAPGREAARRRLREALDSGDAWTKFLEMVALQGGDPSALEDLSRLPAAPVRHTLKAWDAGVVSRVDAGRVGRACLLLGAGRRRTDDRVDPAVGLSDLVKVGDRVEKGAVLAEVHARDEQTLAEALPLLREGFVLAGEEVEPEGLVLERFPADAEVDDGA